MSALKSSIYRAAESPITLKEIQYDNEISKAYAHRIVHEMESDGLVTVKRDKRPHLIERV